MCVYIYIIYIYTHMCVYVCVHVCVCMHTCNTDPYIAGDEWGGEVLAQIKHTHSLWSAPAARCS